MGSRKVGALPSRLSPSPVRHSGHHGFGDWSSRPERGLRRLPLPKFPNRNVGGFQNVSYGHHGVGIRVFPNLPLKLASYL